MKWYIGHVCAHVPHLDLVDFGQNVFSTARFNMSCHPTKISNRLKLQPHKSKILGNVPCFHPGKNVFILTLHALRQLLHWPLISITTSQPMHKTCSSPSKKNFCSRFMRKSLITKILESWLLVAKKVCYKFPNNIASKLSSFIAVNWRFECQPKNAESSRSMQLFFKKI